MTSHSVTQPTSLVRGTEVSAKYKGAFCEATVKDVKKLVKCKVNFKGKGTHTISDELVKGNRPLEVSTVVEAKHPDGTYSEGTIVKITDASQYTVVFDDGDERTLRRTSLCLKGNKHYDETETLNHLPLTNPEYFGTPVVQGPGSSKKGRKRRRLSTSSLDEEGDDEPSDMHASKKLNFGADQSVGKVVFIENGERRRNAWIPALIVPRSLAEDYDLSSPDQCLVRSFKDGKFSVVQWCDMRDFSKDSTVFVAIENGEIPGNKQANDLALQYVETGKLPWDMQLEIHKESVEDSEEYQDVKAKFLKTLYQFMNNRGSPIDQVPHVGNNPVDLCRLYHIVKEKGGMNKVTKQMKWPNVVSQLNITISSPASSASVKTLYRKFLYPFEAFEDLGTDTITEHEESPIPDEETKQSLKATNNKEPQTVDNGDSPSETGNHTNGGNCTAKEEIDEAKEEEKQTASDTEDPEEDEEQRKDNEYAICDNIRVRYGKGRVSSVYEAKIMDIKKARGGLNYLVHYPGWNSRFDEWIRCDRIEGRSTKPPRRKYQTSKGRGRGAPRLSRSLSAQSAEPNSPSQTSTAKSGRRERRSSIIAGAVSDTVGQRNSKRRRPSQTQPSADNGKDGTSDVESKANTENGDDKKESKVNEGVAVEEGKKETIPVDEIRLKKGKTDESMTETVEKVDDSKPKEPSAVSETKNDVTQEISPTPTIEVAPEQLRIQEAALVLGGLHYPSPHSLPDQEVTALSSSPITSLSEAATVSNGETSHSPEDTSSGSSRRAESAETAVDVDDSMQPFVPSPEITKPSTTVGRGRGRGGRGRRRGGRRRGPGSKLSRKDSDLNHRLHGSMSSCSSSANSDSEELNFTLPDISVDGLSPNPKYIVDFTNTSYSASERIEILRSKIDEMRQEYASLKSEMLSIDRKRKRARKRLRERKKALAAEEGKTES